MKSLWTIPLLLLIALSTGAWFRHAAPYPAINIYISSSTGNDSNPCTSGSPCQTLTKAMTFLYGKGSTLNLLAGDTFNESANTVVFEGPNTGIANTFGTLTIQPYGGGTCNPIAGTITGCATIQMVAPATRGMQFISTNNVTVNGIRVLGGAGFLGSHEGTYGIYYDNTVGGNQNFTVENCEVQDLSLLIYINLAGGSFTGWNVEDCYLHGSSSTANVDQGLLTQGTIQNGLVQGNYVTNIGGLTGSPAGTSGNGMLFSNGGQTATFQFNVATNSGVNITSCGGPVGIYDFSAHGWTAQFNEVYGMGQTTRAVGECDQDGMDIDGGSTNDTMQYNYSHDNLGGQFITYVQGTWNTNTIRYNIAEVNHTTQTNVGSAFTFGGFDRIGAGGGATDLLSAVYGNSYATNVDYNITGQIDGECFVAFANYNVVFANNVCYNTGATGAGVLAEYYNSTSGVPYYTPMEWQANHNDYYWTHNSAGNFKFTGTLYTSLASFRLATNQEANSIQVAPGFSGTVPTGGTPCWAGAVIPTGPQPCPSAYNLAHGSALIGAGVNLHATYPTDITVNPTRDYFGNAVPNAGAGTGWNMGADGANH
jgi:hypothetical protein